MIKLLSRPPRTIQDQDMLLDNRSAEKFVVLCNCTIGGQGIQQLIRGCPKDVLC